MEDDGARTSDESAFNRSLAPLAAHLADLGAPRPTYKPYRRPDSKIRRACCSMRRCRYSASSSAFRREISWRSAARKASSRSARRPHPKRRQRCEEAGVDAIAASGFEAGGHRGSFLRPADDSLMGTLSLVPQVVDTVDVPVIAAGGIGRRARRNRRPGARRRGRPDGNGIPGVRGIRRQPPPSRGPARKTRPGTPR